MKIKLDRVRNDVKLIVNEIDWYYHIMPVLGYAKQLIEFYSVDVELLELAVLLHDIGRIKFGSQEHHLTGLPEAKRILKKAGYTDVIINKVLQAIKSHRGSAGPSPKTPLAIILANADAMSHFDILPLFFLINPRKEKEHSIDINGIAQRVEKIKKKLEKDWNEKITMVCAKRIIEQKYKAAILLLENTIKLSEEMN